MANTATRYRLGGWIRFTRIRKPTTDNRNVLAVPTSSVLMPNSSANNIMPAMAMNEVSAAGIERMRTVDRKLPSCFFSLGSKVSRNAGKPMLNSEMSET